MSLTLGVSVGFLLGETFETDPVLTESLATWNKWVEDTPGLDAAIANRIKKDWHDEYGRGRKQMAGSTSSFRNTVGAMREGDWDSRYQEATRVKGNNRDRAKQTGLF